MKGNNMKTKSLFTKTGLIYTIISILFLSTGAIAQEENETVTINGTVVALSFDADDNVIQVGITITEVFDGEESSDTYIVSNAKKGKELLDLVGEDIEVSGTIETDENGDVFITVYSYKVIESEDEPEEEYEVPEDDRNNE